VVTQPVATTAALHQVVVTGIGVVSSLGIGKDEFWKNLLAGRSAVRPVELFDTADHPVKIGAEVAGFDATKFLGKAEAEYYGGASQLGITAARLALKDAGIRPSGPAASNAEVLVGTTIGECQQQEAVIRDWEKGSLPSVDPKDLIRSPDSLLALNVVHALGCDNGGLVFPNACAAGNYALAYGYDLIRHGQITTAMVGGCDAFSEMAFNGFERMLSLAPDNCRPFDKNRKGIVISEGAGMVVLESLEYAQQRGADIYAEMTGYGLSCDANHMTIPHEKRNHRRHEEGDGGCKDHARCGFVDLSTRHRHSEK
jgi:3-oxoacyl-[acyl-carrier-protein] synthase II